MEDLLFSEKDMTLSQFAALSLRVSAKELLSHSDSYDAGYMVGQALRQINRALNNREFIIKNEKDVLEIIKTIHDRSLVDVVYVPNLGFVIESNEDNKK